MILVISIKIKKNHKNSSYKRAQSNFPRNYHWSYRVPRVSRNPTITLLNPRAILNPQHPTLPRLKGLRLRLMEPRTFQINCRRGNPFPVQTIYPRRPAWETFSDGMRSHGESERSEREKESERSAVWMANRLKHNFNPFALPPIYSLPRLNSSRFPASPEDLGFADSENLKITGNLMD